VNVPLVEGAVADQVPISFHGFPLLKLTLLGTLLKIDSCANACGFATRINLRLPRQQNLPKGGFAPAIRFGVFVRAPALLA
jgi:hypothetical protein